MHFHFVFVHLTFSVVGLEPTKAYSVLEHWHVILLLYLKILKIFKNNKNIQQLGDFKVFNRRKNKLDGANYIMELAACMWATSMS